MGGERIKGKKNSRKKGENNAVHSDGKINRDKKRNQQK